jgi:uncharacterized protein
MKSLLLFLVRFYWSFSGLLRPRCRFWPTCSHFFDEAVRTHGAGRGLLLGARRFWRCRPGGGHGYDPVPADAPAPHLAASVPAEARS